MMHVVSMKFAILGAVAVVLANPLNSLENRAASAKLLPDAKIALSIASSSILSHQLKPQHQTDRLTEYLVTKYFATFNHEQQELLRIFTLLAPGKTANILSDGKVITRFKADLEPQVSDACFKKGWCNVEEVAKYARTYFLSLMVETCAKHKDIEGCKNIAYKPRCGARSMGPDHSTKVYIRMENSCDEWRWQKMKATVERVEHSLERRSSNVCPYDVEKGPLVDVDKVIQEIETRLNFAASIVIDVECPPDMDAEEFRRCMKSQQEPLALLREQLGPQSFEYSEGMNEGSPYGPVTYGCGFPSHNPPPPPKSTLKPATPNYSSQCPVATETVTVWAKSQQTPQYTRPTARDRTSPTYFGPKIPAPSESVAFRSFSA